MTRDTLTLGPNWSYNNKDVANYANYDIPLDYSELHSSMFTTGGGGGGGAHAYHDGWLQDRHARAGGGGGAAGTYVTFTVLGAFPLISFSGNVANAYIFPLKGSHLQTAQLGGIGKGGAGTYKTSGSTVSATGQDGTSAGDTKIVFKNGNVSLSFVLYGGYSGKGGYARATSTDTSSTPGNGGSINQMLLFIQIDASQGNNFISIEAPSSASSNLIFHLGDLILSQDARLYDQSGDLIGEVYISNSSVSLRSVPYDCSFEVTWQRGYSRQGSSGSGSTGGSGGSYISSIYNSYGGRGGDGDNDSLNGADGQGQSKILMEVVRDNPFLYTYIPDPSAPTTNLLLVPTQSISVKDMGHVKDISVYSNNGEWVRANGPEKNISTGPVDDNF